MKIRKLLFLVFALTCNIAFADPSAAPVTDYSASGNLLQYNSSTNVFSVKEGTLTNGKACTYSTTSGLVCTSDFGTISGTLNLTGIISPPSFAVSQNNYNPTGLSTAETIRLNPTANVNITGIAGCTDGRQLTLQNISAFYLILANESSSSTAGNRIIAPFNDSQGLLITPGSEVTIRCDGTVSRWRGTENGVLQASAGDGSITVSNTRQFPTISVGQNFSFDWTNVHRFHDEAQFIGQATFNNPTAAVWIAPNSGVGTKLLFQPGDNSSDYMTFRAPDVGAGFGPVDYILPTNPTTAGFWYHDGAGNTYWRAVDGDTFVDETTDYSLGTDDCGKTFTNRGTGSDITFDFSSQLAGCTYTIINYDPHDFKIYLKNNTSTSVLMMGKDELIVGNIANSPYHGSIIKFESLGDEYWITKEMQGDWEYTP